MNIHKKAFESWVKEVAPQSEHMLVPKDDRGEYDNLAMHWAFEAWKQSKTDAYKRINALESGIDSLLSADDNVTINTAYMEIDYLRHLMGKS